jgi:hypothetical protein
LDIDSTFTNGAFTGVTNANIRLTNNTTSYGILSFGGAEEIATEQIAAKFNTSTTGKELAVSLNNTSGRHWKIRSLSSGDFDIRNITNSITPATFSATGLATFRNNINFDLGKSYLGQQFAGGTGLWLNKNTFTTSTYSLWSDGTSTYFNTTSSGTINFRINNADKMLLASTGNFLINTTTDAGFKLDVSGTARVQTSLAVTTGKTFSAYTSSAANDALKLEVNNLGAVFGVQNSNASGFSGIEYLSNAGVPRVFTGFNNGNGQEFRFNNFASGGYIDFLISSTSGLRIANTRNILINTTTDAGFRLDVNGTARIQSKLSVGTPTAASAVMEVTSTTQGFLPPRMTNAQMLAIATPAAGLIVYDTTNNKHCGYNGTAWQNFY